MAPVLDLSAYVLAGGRSSRMGQDKALMELGGLPLIAHAVNKLRRVCPNVHILSEREELADYAPLVPDRNTGCGPMGGLEAALVHSSTEWNLFLPVDMPFFPVEIMFDQKLSENTRARLFVVDGVPQPLFCLLHRDFGPFIRKALEQGNYKVFPVLEDAGRQLARRLRVPVEHVFLTNTLPGGRMVMGGKSAGERDGETLVLTPEQIAVRELWFANLNTPEEFAEAERHLDALDAIG